MNMDDAGRITELMHDVHLAVAVAFYEGDNQLIVDYADLKPHRNGEPRAQTTHMDALYTLQTARGGVDYALRTETSPHAGMMRLVFVKFEANEGVRK